MAGAYRKQGYQGSNMSAWRRRAIQSWPEAAAFVQDPETTVYLLLFELPARRSPKATLCTEGFSSIKSAG
jgi:hypothetical protein